MREGGSIHNGHFHIREHNGVMPGADKAECLKAVVGGIRFGSEGEQDFGTDLLIDAFVVDEQRARRMLWLVHGVPRGGAQRRGERPSRCIQRARVERRTEGSMGLAI